MRSFVVLTLLLACSVAVVHGLSQPPKDMHEWGAFDKAISSDKMWKERWSVNFFDPRVFDWLYYLSKHPVLKERGINTYRLAKLHWINVGIREGWQASPDFSPFMYLKQNKDVRDMFGKENYPFAIIHYLTVGVHETYRPTGGPERIDIFDPRIFDWQWYIEHNRLAASSITTEALARAHWKAIGLDGGLQASPNVHLLVYLRNNTDLRVKYGDDNFRAALSHWLDQGFKETWRENGGQTCTFWSTWCLEDHRTVHDWANKAPILPQYNSTNSTISSPPIPTNGGWSIRINNRECQELSKVFEKPKDSSRVVEIRHFRWRRYKHMRECNVFVRHFIDIQTTVQEREPMSLALFHWMFNDSVPQIALENPLARPPAQYVYKGWTYGKHVPSHDKPTPTFNEMMEDSDITYNISNVIMETPWDRINPDHIPMSPQYLYDVTHIYRMSPNAIIKDSTRRNYDGTVGVSEQDLNEEARGATHHQIDPSLYVPVASEKNAPPPPAPVAPANATLGNGTVRSTVAAPTPAPKLVDEQAVLANLTSLANAHKQGLEPEEPSAVRKAAHEAPAAPTPAPVVPKKVEPVPLKAAKYYSKWATPFNSPYVKAVPIDKRAKVKKYMHIPVQLP